MAKVFYYSKRYSQQGDPIKKVSYEDLFLLSTPVPVELPYKLGFRTYSATLDQLKTYTVDKIKSSGFTFTFSDGLIGNGTLSEPVRVDKAWVNQTYIPSNAWAFSQVGDPTDYQLPISGTYASVSYPYFNDFCSPVVPYVEGNGDMRILRTVTNGETVSVVFSIWKNYKNTPISTLIHTDIIYSPYGLASDEYIMHVYSASDTAMLAEIWVKGGGYREHAFIVLDGSLQPNSHRIVRLGDRIFSGMFGVTDATAKANWMRWMRTCNINAAIVKDRMYIGMVIPPDIISGPVRGARGGIVRMIFAEVFNDGRVVFMPNWTVTNSEGNVVYDPNLAIFNVNLVAYSKADKDALIVSLADPAKVGFGIGADISTATTNQSFWGGVNSNGHTTCVISHFCVVRDSERERDVKPTYYYDIDFQNHRITPSTGATNRRWVYGVDSAGRYKLLERSKTYLESYYWVQGRMIGLLNNGDRFCQDIPADSGVPHRFFVMRGEVTSVDTGTNDANFVNDNLNTFRYMTVQPPTPVQSGGKATLLHDKLRIINTGGEGWSSSTTSKTLSLISGASNGKTYQLLDNSNPSIRTNWVGYPLNNNRTTIANPQPPGMVCVRKNGVRYYHNAGWSSNDSVNTVFSYGINSDSIGQYSFKLSQTVTAKIASFMQTLPLQSGYSLRSDQYWTFVPLYPGIGEDYALIRLLSSSKTPDSTSIDGFARSPIGHVLALVPITIVIDSLGTATITDINLSGVNTALTTVSDLNTFINSQIWHNRGSAAFDITDTGYKIIHRGGPDVARYENYSSEVAWPIAAEFNMSRQLTRYHNRIDSETYNSMPTIHPEKGIGVVGFSGLGAFYAFRPYNFETNKLGSGSESILVGTARPAAGFNLTISAPITVYVEGVMYTIQPGVIDLTQITTNYRSTVFYCYVEIRDGVAKFVPDLRILEEHLHRIYVGYIRTSNDEITEIVCTPITRWEVARPSAAPLGSALPATMGLPHEVHGTVWVGAQTTAGTPMEYLWGSDDIIDSD